MVATHPACDVDGGDGGGHGLTRHRMARSQAMPMVLKVGMQSVDVIRAVGVGHHICGDGLALQSLSGRAYAALTAALPAVGVFLAGVLR